MQKQVILSLISFEDNKELKEYCGNSCSVEFVDFNEANKRFKPGEHLFTANLSRLDLIALTASGEWMMWVNNHTTPADIKIAESYIKKYPDRWAVGGYSKKNRLTDYFYKDTSYSLPFVFKKSYLIENFPLEKISLEKLVAIAYSNKRLQLSNTYVSKTPGSQIKKIAVPFVSLLLSKVLKNTSSKKELPTTQQVPLQYGLDLPIFINCRDRVSPLLKMVKTLESAGLKNIIFIDNASTYKPLLKYYENTTYTTVRLTSNLGQRAPWLSGAIALFAKDMPFVVTDPDLVLPTFSDGKMKIIFKIMNKHPRYIKVGLALRIDNLPESYRQKDQVIKWEKQFWKNKIEKNIYIADVDTTFALYRPNTPYIIRPALRVAGEYTAEHEPWYQDSANPTDEYIYYLKHARREIASWGIDDATSSDVYKS